MRQGPPKIVTLSVVAATAVLALGIGVFEFSRPDATPADAGNAQALSQDRATGSTGPEAAVLPGASTADTPVPSEPVAVALADRAGGTGGPEADGVGGPFIPSDTDIADLAAIAISAEVAEPPATRVEAPDVVLPLPKPRPGSTASGLRPGQVSLDEMIGQMIMVGFKGTSPRDPWPAKLVGQIASGQVGGVLFLERNAASREAVATLNETFLRAGGGTPVFIAIDQEGGAIERLNSRIGFTERPSARDVGRTLTVAEAKETYAGLAGELKALNFNLNLGPVVDVDINPSNPIIGALGRSFSADPGNVAAYAAAFIDGHHARGMMTAVKHFPGHGSSRGDSHKGFVDISGTWSDAELQPYSQLIAAGTVDMVMTGHLYLDRMAPAGSRLPSSLSGKAIDVLRDNLGFTGVVISDDMEMKAIGESYSVEDAAIAAVRAGTDILVYSNFTDPRPDLPATIIATLKRKAEEDPAFRQMIVESHARIMALKQRLGRADIGRNDPIGALATGGPAPAPARGEAVVQQRSFTVPNLN